MGFDLAMLGVAALLGIADAKWWIDNRDATDAQLLASAGVAQAPG